MRWPRVYVLLRPLLNLGVSSWRVCLMLCLCLRLRLSVATAHESISVRVVKVEVDSVCFLLVEVHFLDGLSFFVKLIS